MTKIQTPPALAEAVKALWCIPPPGPNNLLSDPRFVKLRNTCESLYPGTKSEMALSFALSHALRALGLPCQLVPANADVALAAEIAAAQLDAAFCQTHVRRVYLCPLDWGGNLPTLKFGDNRVRKFTIGEFEAVLDPNRLKRLNPNWTFDAERFSEFSWMVVEETCALTQDPGERAMPWFFVPIGDWRAIEPHRERFPTAVEKALFAVLLAPWEDWAESPDNDWRCFRLPWVYTLSDDIFVLPLRPPSPDTLSWEPLVLEDGYGSEYETEQPSRYRTKGAAAEINNWLNSERWSDVGRARLSPLLSDTPIAHFLVRAFLDEPLDEFLAHITTIEAALGLRSDYKRGRRATRRVGDRVSALLDETSAGEDYRPLFDLRSTFLHGRAMEAIPGRERMLARRLARRVVNALVEVARATPGSHSREAYLNDLLARGSAKTPPARNAG